MASPIKCVGVNDNDTPATLAEKLGAVLGHVLSNCVTGFGHKWAEHYARLQESLITADFEWKPLGNDEQEENIERIDSSIRFEDDFSGTIAEADNSEWAGRMEAEIQIITPTPAESTTTVAPSSTSTTSTTEPMRTKKNGKPRKPKKTRERWQWR